MKFLQKIITNTGCPEDIGNVSKDTSKMLDDIFSDINGVFRDYHNHIVGVKECANGNFVTPLMTSWKNPIKHIMFLTYKNAGKIKTLENADAEYVDYFVRMVRNLGTTAKFYILAFDKSYNKDGIADYAKTEFYVSNKYIYELSEKYPNIFIPIISVNPRRKDAIDKLAEYAELGVRFVKWLPNAMGFSPDDESFQSYYETMAKYKMILLSHTGYEAAVNVKDFQKFGNPLLLKTPLDYGVKVIAAHCAMEGKNIDLESKDKKVVYNFDLFLKMMDKKEYADLLYGDISALTLRNRKLKFTKKLLSRKDLHHRLINGSDYPLPAINILIHTNHLCSNGFISKKEKYMLKEVFKYNPLLFDYALKRLIKNPDNGDKFPSSIFTRKL